MEMLYYLIGNKLSLFTTAIDPISQEFSDFNLNFDRNGDIFPGYDIEKNQQTQGNRKSC